MDILDLGDRHIPEKRKWRKKSMNDRILFPHSFFLETHLAAAAAAAVRFNHLSFLVKIGMND